MVSVLQYAVEHRSVITAKREQIRSAKEGARHAHRQARGNRVSVDASIKTLKRELRDMFKTFRRVK